MLLSTLSTNSIEYKASRYYRWSQSEDEITPECSIKDCRHIIIGYSFKEVPEFNEIQDRFADKNYVEALLRQKNLIDTVSSVFFNTTNNLTGYLELRLSNDIERKTINCYLLLRIILISSSAYYNPKRLQEEFKKLIPDEYLVVPLESDEIEKILALNNQSLVEIRKTTNYLPVGSFYQEGSSGIAPRNLIEWDPRIRYHIPCVSYLEPKTYNLSNLYKTLQNATEPVQIRISIGSTKVFEFEKNLALQYHNMLKTTYASVATPEILTNISAFSKYISFTQLFSLKMQVAAGTEVTAMSLANAFCGQLSYGEVKAQTNLYCFSLKKYDSEVKRLDWEECNHTFYNNDKRYKDFGDLDETIESFILRMPYLSDSSEAMAVFRLPVTNATGLPGLVTKPIKPFYQPNPKDKSRGDFIKLGNVITSSTNEHKIPYSLPLSDLTKHGLIVGATGSGKTNTILNFVKELIERDIPFLLIEPVKAEYYHELLPLFKNKKEPLHRFHFSNPRLEDNSINPQFLRFNPFIPQQNITTFQHLSYIKSCFMAAFPMFGILPLIFEDCLYEYFKKPLLEFQSSNLSVKGLKETDFFDAKKIIPFYVSKELPNGKIEQVNNDYRTLFGFSKYITQYLKDNDKLFDAKMKTELEGSLNRRFAKLTKGLLGQVFCPEKWRENGKTWSTIPDNLETVLNKSCIIELEALPENEDKALIMAFLLSYLFENRQTRKSHSSSNQLHVTIIEEAHRLLSSSSMKSTGGSEGASLTQDSGSKTISLFIDMLAEIRAKNQAIFIVEQSPTKLVADVIKNTNLKIMHRLTNKSDRNYLGEAMNMDEQQSRYATTLQQGEALIFEEQLDKPILVKMNSFEKSELTMNEDGDYKNLKNDLARQEGESWIRAYPDYPVDGEGNPISDKTTKELGVTEIAGGDHQRKIDKIDSLKERFGGETEDWVSFKAPAREGEQIGGFKNLDSGIVSLNQEPANIEQRRQEQIEKNKANQDIMNNTDTQEQAESKDTQTAENFAENKGDVIDKVEPVESSDGNTDSTNDIVDKVEPIEASEEEFSDNQSDVVDKVEPINDTKAEFDENTESMDVETESSTDTLNNDFNENAEDITGANSDTDDDPDDYTYDLKPGS